MAIAGIVLQVLPVSLGEVSASLQAVAEILDVRPAPPDRIAASVECASIKILAALKKIGSMPGVINLELVYVNYEDDLESTGTIACPPLSDLEER